LGFVPQRVFTKLVIMVAVTTVMTGRLPQIVPPNAGYAVPFGVEA
jgi:hypothetical protein